MKKYLCIAAVALAATILNTSCVAEPPDNADSRQKRATELALAEADRQVGMPGITNYQQRKLMKAIYELCDKEDLVCHAYLQSQLTGKLLYLGKCIGYGIPFSAQFTNPMKVIDGEMELGVFRDGNGITTIPQADPNGLFMPTSSSATWLMLVDPQDGKPRPVYCEPGIVVSPFKLPATVEEPVAAAMTEQQPQQGVERATAAN